MDRFPLEINLEIIRCMVTCSDRLSFAQRRMSKQKSEAEAKKSPHLRQVRTSRFGGNLRVVRWKHCEGDEPVSQALVSNFAALCLVSREMRQLARLVFFAENRWVMHTSSLFNGVSWVMKHWGAEAVALMRDVRIHIQEHWLAGYESLETFVGAARKERSLQNLSVLWVNGLSRFYHAPNSHRSWHYHPLWRDYEHERNGDGGRGVSVTAGDPENPEEATWITPEVMQAKWASDEVLLIPLGELRGLKNVRIEGCVTEEWASWLEKTMTTEDGKLAPGFKFRTLSRSRIESLEIESPTEYDME